MNKILIFLILIFSANLYSLEYGVKTPIDAKKFGGQWREIARTYNDIQENCVYSSVEYRFKEEYSFDVINSCDEFSKDGDKKLEFKGKMELSLKYEVPTLEMTYYWIFTSYYKILYLNDTYTTTVIADQDYKNLWIMTRDKTISEEEKTLILDNLANKLDIEKLIFFN